MTTSRIIAALLTAVLAAAALPAGAHAAVSDPEALSRAKEELRASDAEWKREQQAYRARREAGAMSKAEADEYAGFVASLQRRKLENCEAVRRLGGNEALDGFDCLQPKSGAPGAEIRTAPDAAGAKTEGEKIGALEAELKKLEAELDETLMRKQEALRNKARGGGGASGGGSEGGSGGGQGTGSGSGAAQGSASSGAGTGRAGSSGSRQQAARNGAGQARGNTASGSWGDPDAGKRSSTGEAGQPPGDPKSGSPGGNSSEAGVGPGAKRTPDNVAATGGGPESGDDDDIVMRQIREAAERETDPVMKEKLWEEYRKLKEQRQKKP